MGITTNSRISEGKEKVWPAEKNRGLKEEWKESGRQNQN